MTNEFGVRPGFISGVAGHLFVLELVPDTPAVGTVLIVPPFAEEMNRSRRMLTLQARRLAAYGYRVVMPDLYGTGDSAGNFSDARWDIWRSDLASVVGAACIDNSKPVFVLALRLGALLALDAVSHFAITADKLVFWNPCISGSQFITRFLRIRLLASMIRGEGPQETATSLRALLQQGETVEVAGYSLSGDLVNHIDSLELPDLVADQSASVCWFEVIGGEDKPFPIPASRIADELIGRGINIEKRVIYGPQFWATPEIATAPELLAETTIVFEGLSHR